MKKMFLAVTLAASLWAQATLPQYRGVVAGSGSIPASIVVGSWNFTSLPDPLFPSAPRGSGANLIKQSVALDQSPWTASNVTVTRVAGAGPNIPGLGVVDAWRLTESVDGSAVGHTVSQQASFTAGTTYLLSAYIPSSSQRWTAVSLPGSAFGTGKTAWFDPSTGNFGAVDAPIYAKQAYSGGTRIWIGATATTTATANLTVWVVSSNNTANYQGNGSSLLVAAPQLEALSDANVTLGAELVTNGGFDQDASWTKGAGASISGGVGTASGTPGTAEFVQTITLNAGKLHQVRWEVPTRSGISLQPYFNGGTAVGGSIAATSGKFTDYLVTATGNTGIVFQVWSGTGSATLDNVSVREVTAVTPTSYVPTTDKQHIWNGAASYLGNPTTATVSADGMSGSGLVGNLLAKSEPLLADLSHKTAGVTQASFTELGLSNGVQFPANSVSEDAYVQYQTINGQQYVLSAFVVMADSSAPTNSDFRPYVSGMSPTFTVTQVTGNVYRVTTTFTSTGGSSSTGFYATNAQSGKAFRVTGFSLTTTPGPYVRTTATNVPMHPNVVRGGELVWPLLQSGSTNSAVGDGNDPTQYGGPNGEWRMTTDDYGTTVGAIQALNLSSDWSIFIIGKFDGTVNFPVSLGVPGGDYDHASIRHASSGQVFIRRFHVGEVPTNSASNLTVPTTQLVPLRFMNRSGTLYLKRLDTGGEISLSNTATGFARFTLGSLASTAGSVVDSLHVAYTAILNRALTPAQEQWLVQRCRALGYLQ